MDNTVKRDYAYYLQLSPSQYPEELARWFRNRTGKELNLDNPQTFNEKIQWLKLYDATPEKTRLADKYLVREWIREKIGEQYLIPLLGVWDSADDIDFDALPDSFVLKCNHASSWNVIVRDKRYLDRDEARRQLNYWTRKNFALCSGFELHYGPIVPKIVGEQYISDLDSDIEDYRFFCFDGEIKTVWVDVGSGTDHHRRAIFDPDWNYQDFRVNYPPIEPVPQRPDTYDEMLRLAKILSEGFACVRVDFYSIRGKVYFGEMTFTSQSGVGSFDPEEMNLLYGSWIKLPPKRPLPEKSFAELGYPEVADKLIRYPVDCRAYKSYIVASTEKWQQEEARLRDIIREKQDRLVRTWAEKSEVNAKLKRTYDEKFERGVEIKRLNAELKQLRKENKQLSEQLSQKNKALKQCRSELKRVRKSTAFKIGRVLTWPARALK